MSVVAFGSVRGAPGVTTTAMLVAAALPSAAAFVEADLSGGVLAARYGLGREPGLTTLAASLPMGPADWREHAQDAGGVATLVGPDSLESARSLWRRAGDQIGRSLAASDATMVADVGRIGDGTPLLADVSLLVLLVRPVTEHLVTLSHHLSSLRTRPSQLRFAVVLVGDGAYRPADVTGPLDVEVLASLPDDHRAAEALCGVGPTPGLGRSRLFRSAAGLASDIHASLGTATEAVEARR